MKLTATCTKLNQRIGCPSLTVAIFTLLSNSQTFAFAGNDNDNDHDKDKGRSTYFSTPAGTTAVGLENGLTAVLLSLGSDTRTVGSIEITQSGIVIRSNGRLRNGHPIQIDFERRLKKHKIIGTLLLASDSRSYVFNNVKMSPYENLYLSIDEETLPAPPCVSEGSPVAKPNGTLGILTKKVTMLASLPSSSTQSLVDMKCGEYREKVISTFLEVSGPFLSCLDEIARKNSTSTEISRLKLVVNKARSQAKLKLDDAKAIFSCGSVDGNRSAMVRTSDGAIVLNSDQMKDSPVKKSDIAHELIHWGGEKREECTRAYVAACMPPINNSQIPKICVQPADENVRAPVATQNTQRQMRLPATPPTPRASDLLIVPPAQSSVVTTTSLRDGPGLSYTTTNQLDQLEKQIVDVSAAAAYKIAAAVDDLGFSSTAFAVIPDQAGHRSEPATSTLPPLPVKANDIAFKPFVDTSPAEVGTGTTPTPTLSPVLSRKPAAELSAGPQPAKDIAQGFPNTGGFSQSLVSRGVAATAESRSGAGTPLGGRTQQPDQVAGPTKDVYSKILSRIIAAPDSTALLRDPAFDRELSGAGIQILDGESIYGNRVRPTFKLLLRDILGGGNR